MVKADNGQEIPGVVVGGDILPDAPISGTKAGDGEERKRQTWTQKSNADVAYGQDATVDGKELHNKIVSLSNDGHLFNLVAKGFSKPEA
jgi:hypothetical protein